MTRRVAITSVQPLQERWLRLGFSDGAVIDVDLAPVLERGGVFAQIRDDRKAFEQVRVDDELGTIAWPEEIDLDAAVLYGLYEPADGTRLERRVVQPA